MLAFVHWFPRSEDVTSSLVRGSQFNRCPLTGTINVPGDKSLSHRVILFAALANGCSRVRGLLDSFDVRSTLAAVESLGAHVELVSDSRGLSGTITGPIANSIEKPFVTREALGTQEPGGTREPLDPQEPLMTKELLQIDCGNSGTTTRLLLGLLSGRQLNVTLTGDESLNRRPMRRVTEPLSRMGAAFSPMDYLPITIQDSTSLQAIDYHSPIASAQVKSAILLAGLSAQGTTSISEPHKSRDHTELLLPAFGVAVCVDGLKVSIEGGQELKPCDCDVPGDPSSAAFLLIAAALLPQSQVTITNMSLNPTRIGFLAVMHRMGARIEIEINEQGTLGQELTGDVTVSWGDSLKATTVTAEEIPTLIDEVPILALLATAASGTTRFEGVGELRVKESDRLSAIVEGLAELGCCAVADGDDLIVDQGPPTHSEIVLAAHGDHRLAMTWIVAAHAFALDIEVPDIDCCGVSYPGFITDLLSLSKQ